MKYYITLFLLLTGLSLNAYGQIESAVFSPLAPRELNIKIKKNPPSDITKLRIVISEKTQEGNVEIQSPAAIESSDINSIGGKTQIRVAVLNNLDPAKLYSVTISGYTIDDKTFSFEAFSVTPALSAKLFYNPRDCATGIQLIVNVPKAFRREGDEIIKWLEKFEQNPSGGAKIETAQGNENYEPRRIRFIKGPVYRAVPVDEKFQSLGFNEINACFDLEDDLFGSYAIKLNFTREPDTPLALQKEIKVENFGETEDETADITQKNAFVRKGDPGQRTLDNDIEAGFTFTNSKDNSTGKRVSRAVLDLQIAPIRNRPFLFVGGDKTFSVDDKNIPEWFGYWTPVFLDANVSTGKITNNTLSLNRIAIGGNFEFRYLPVEYESDGKAILPRFATFHSFKFNYTHYSDRDFKQNEIVAGFEYSPISGRLNRPRKMNFEFVPRPSSGKSVKAPGKYGYTFVPSIGFDFGRTYLRRNPASAIQPSPNIRRLYTKFTGKFEYKFFGLSLTEQLYYRGESKTDKFKNYFEADFETLLNEFANNFKHAIFLNYKLGSAPPFNTKVDALTVGYRIRINR
jgi:hypothetical protein